MIILTVLGVLLIACIIWGRYTNYGDDGILSELGIIIIGVVLVFFILALPFERCGFNSNLKKLQAFEMTLDNMRKKESIENTAIQMEVAKWNQWIAGKKYWNDTLFDIWIPDEIKTIEFIK
jgi:Zn-dependent membrane protease YugP